MVRLTDHPGMTIAVYHGCKAPDEKIFLLQHHINLIKCIVPKGQWGRGLGGGGGGGGII